MNITVRKLLWVFGTANSSLTLMGVIALSESNLNAVQTALIMNAAASTIVFITLGIGELITKTNPITHTHDTNQRPRCARGMQPNGNPYPEES